MIIKSIVNLAREYLLTGVILVLVVVALFLIYRFVRSKRGEKEHKKINGKRLLWWFVFLCYIFMVFAATMFNRNSVYEAQGIRPLFSSYKVAWYGWVKSEWRNIILNYILFVPLGFLLPMGIKFFRRFYRTALVGFLYSLFIEITQRISKLGVFEPDDLFDNTLGAVIGYGLFMIAFAAFTKVRGGEKVKTAHVVFANVPTVLVGCAFLAILLCYRNQELGNNNNTCINTYPAKLLNFSGATFDDETATTLPVYKCKLLDDDEALSLAGEIFEKFGKGSGVGISNFYEDIGLFWSEKVNAAVWIKYKGGTFEYTNYSDKKKDNATFTKEEVKDILLSFGFDVVNAGYFTEGSDYKYSFKYDMREYGDLILDGRLDVHLCEDKTVKDMQYTVYPLTHYKDYEVISEAEAYRQLISGRFKSIESSHLDIEVLRCDIHYSIDTKGFYQPNYRFHVIKNGKEAWIMIPALKQ